MKVIQPAASKQHQRQRLLRKLETLPLPVKNQNQVKPPSIQASKVVKPQPKPQPEPQPEPQTLERDDDKQAQNSNQESFLDDGNNDPKSGNKLINLVTREMDKIDHLMGLKKTQFQTFAQQEQTSNQQEKVKEVQNETKAKTVAKTEVAQKSEVKAQAKTETKTNVKKSDKKQAASSAKTTGKIPATTSAAHSKTLKPPTVEKNSVNPAIKK